MALERVFALISTYENKSLLDNPSIIGDIFDNIFWWGFSFDDYEKNNENNLNFPIVKVFSTRK